MKSEMPDYQHTTHPLSFRLDLRHLGRKDRQPAVFSILAATQSLGTTMTSALSDWHEAEIHAAIKEADAGDFAPDQAVNALAHRWAEIAAPEKWMVDDALACLICKK